MSGGLDQTMAGRTVTLAGEAIDLKAGAALRLDSGELVLIEGRHSWAPAERGSRLSASGVLHYRPPRPPDPTVQQVSGGGWSLQTQTEATQ